MGALSLQKPSKEKLRRFLAEQDGVDFSYPAVGASAETPPAGFVVDRTRVDLGEGEEVFEAARAALQRWEQFQLGWVEAWSPDTPLEQGQTIAVMGWAIGMWWLNCCRIIYTVDDFGMTRRFGFAYGTLPSHVEKGEERFLIEWDQETGRVSYDILAFSRPNHILTRIGYPMVRLSQKRFGRESAAAMLRAVNASAPMPEVCQSTQS